MNSLHFKPDFVIIGTRRSSARGFTLLELMLALTLSVFVVSAVATAIHMYLNNLNKIQKKVELSQVSHNTLLTMADDIRGAVQYSPADVSGLEELFASQVAAVAGPPSSSESEESWEGSSVVGDSAGLEPSGTESTVGDSTTGGSTGSSVVPTATEDCANCRPRFIGTSKTLSIDVSRLPRIDQYHPIIHSASNGSYTSLPTDIKTVAYFVSQSSDNGSGLFRREIDRAVAGYKGENGLQSNIDEYCLLLATEIVDVSFSYVDLEDNIHNDWDSDAEFMFPKAVIIVLTVDPSRLNADLEQQQRFSQFDPDTMQQYTRVVHLPISEVPTVPPMQSQSAPAESNSSGSAASTEGAR